MNNNNNNNDNDNDNIIIIIFFKITNFIKKLAQNYTSIYFYQPKNYSVQFQLKDR